MIKVGVTGGIGSGKTTVCRIFQSLRVPIYYADDRAKILMAEDEQLKSELISHFGEGVYQEDGSLNRIWLAGQVFGDPLKLEQLNAIVHPAVGRDAEQWQLKHQSAPYTIKEAALLFEAGSYKKLDKIIVVTAPENLRIRRVMDRDHIDEGAVRQRMDRQWPQEKKAALADFIIENDGSKSLIPQVLEIHHKLLELAKKPKEK